VVQADQARAGRRGKGGDQYQEAGRRTLRGGTMAMASFWGIEICEGLESPLSLFMDIRNCAGLVTTAGVCGHHGP
jgi:hypothetical protein